MLHNSCANKLCMCTNDTKTLELNVEKWYNISILGLCMENVKHINTKNKSLTFVFCVHWYDPSNIHIKSVNPFLGLWDYEVGVKSYCDLIHKEICSERKCGRFASKLPKT